MKTTKADFEYFKKRCIHWAKELGLHGIEFTFLHDDEESRGSYQIVYEDGVCVVHFQVEWDWPRPRTKKEINRIAFHEMAEIMIQPLKDLARERYNEEVVSGEAHKIVRRLENLVLGFEA